MFVKVVLDSNRVRAGSSVTGTVVGDDGTVRAAYVALRSEEHCQGYEPARGPTVVDADSDSVTGRFELPVPPDALPSWTGRSVSLRWRIRAAEQKSIFPVRDADSWVTIVNTRPPSFPGAAGAGAEPPMFGSERRSRAALLVWGPLSVIFMAGLGAILLASDDGPVVRWTGAGFLATGLIQAILLGFAYRSRFPKPPANFDLSLEPPAIAPGGSVAIRGLGDTPTDLQLLNLESYQSISRRGVGEHRSRSIWVQRRHLVQEIKLDSTGFATVTLPPDAGPTYSSDRLHHIWVVRGSRRWARWAPPATKRDWHLVVTPSDDAEN